MKLVPLLAAAALSAALLPAPRAGDAGRAPQAGGAARDIRPADTPCDLPAYVADPDPRGLNVRSGPGTPFPVVGVIPHKGGSAVGLTVTGSSGPWVRIKDAAVQEDGEAVFGGEGWVFAGMLATETKNYSARDPRALVVKLYASPSLRSRVVTRLPSEMEVRLAGCKGGWAQVRSGKATGWLDPESQCASTLTTCS